MNMRKKHENPSQRAGKLGPGGQQKSMSGLGSAIADLLYGPSPTLASAGLYSETPTTDSSWRSKETKLTAETDA